MSYHADMTPKQALSELAKSVSVNELAELANISTKTVYRIRHLKANPSLDMVASIEAAVKQIRERVKPAATTQTAPADRTQGA